MNIFEKASKQSLRFDTSLGCLSVEDLWNMKLTHLDEMAVYLNSQLSKSDTVSFISNKKSENEILQLKFDIAKHIIDVRLEDIAEAENAIARKAEKQKILEAISNIESAEFGEKTKEELNDMLAKL